MDPAARRHRRPAAALVAASLVALILRVGGGDSPECRGPERLWVEDAARAAIEEVAVLVEETRLREPLADPGILLVRVVDPARTRALVGDGAGWVLGGVEVEEVEAGPAPAGSSPERDGLLRFRVLFSPRPEGSRGAGLRVEALRSFHVLPGRRGVPRVELTREELVWELSSVAAGA